MSESSTNGSGVRSPNIHFPIEGHSIWPVILWMLFSSSIAAIFAINVTLNMMDLGDLPIEKGPLMKLIVGFFIFEYLAVRHLIVPNMTDYGRYRIYADRVDFYPLVLLGLCVTSQCKGELSASFKGVKINISVSKDKPTFYRVDLIHPRKGYTLKVKYFLDMPDAQVYARELADAMKLPLLEQD